MAVHGYWRVPSPRRCPCSYQLSNASPINERQSFSSCSNSGRGACGRLGFDAVGPMSEQRIEFKVHFRISVPCSSGRARLAAVDAVDIDHRVHYSARSAAELAASLVGG